MQYFMDRQILDIEGKALANPDKTIATMRTAAIMALTAVYTDEQTLSGEEKLKRWDLAQRIYKETDPVELKAEEVALIKKLVGKAFAVTIVGNVYSFFEGGN